MTDVAFASNQPMVQGAIVLVLPEPPSANRWWRKWRNRMVLSDEAREYKTSVCKQAGVKDAPIFPHEDVSVVMFWRRSLKSGDLDKRLGVLLDALQSVSDRIPDPTAKGRTKSRRIILTPGIYDSDAQVAQLWARRCDEHPQLEPGTVRVEISAM